MTLKKCYLMVCLGTLVVLAMEIYGEEKIDTEKNEIPYEKDEETKKIKPSNSDHPVSVPPLVEHESKLSSFVCPNKNEPKPLLSLPCFSTMNCGFLGRDMLCCEGKCLKGVKRAQSERHHEPLFGIIERKCPIEPLTELSEVKQCHMDDECTPRICCGDTSPNVKYCRTPIPVWDSIPLPPPVLEPLKTLTGYMQCTPPPPHHLDLYPKSCQSLVDCFPNLCCQENGKKYCRPPKRSLLALVAELGQRIIPEDAARKFIERIS
ncbi:hypothetical protein ABEB36_002255 [Hypothenemus hampei]|uniref:WAP domain-containing protein n=1 Tax=Hypothenemus hampei TaxID=57062 RepID=A0ABD1F533_HYPHA